MNLTSASFILDKDEVIYLGGSQDGEIQLHTDIITINNITIKQLKRLRYEIDEAIKRNQKI